MSNTVISHIEHTLAGALLWTVPLILAGIPTSWTNMTVGAVIGLVWSLARTFISNYAANQDIIPESETYPVLSQQEAPERELSDLKNSQKAMKLSTIKQMWYVLYLFARGYIATGVANRIGMKKQFENFYFERLKTVDPVTFDKAYFSDVSAMVKDTREKYDRLSKWNILTLALLILCVLGGLDTFSYYGTSLKIRDFSTLILLVYSTTKLQLMNLNLSIVTRESLLRAHALSVASEVDCDLYRLRYALLDTPSIEDIYRPGLPGAPVISRKPVHANLAANFVMLFFGGYLLFYFVVATYALLLPGLNPVFRILAVSTSIVCELISTLGGIFLEYGATKDSNAIRNYVQIFMSIINKPPNTAP